MNRRGFLMGLGGAVLAAPAIVRVAANLMPVRATVVIPEYAPYSPGMLALTDIIDMQEATREYLRGLNIPQHWLRAA